MFNERTERSLLLDAENCVTLSRLNDRYIIKNEVLCADERDVAKILVHENLYDAKNMQVGKFLILGMVMLYFTFTANFLPGICFQKRSILFF